YSICHGYGVGLFGPTVYASAADIFYGRNPGAVIGFLIMGMGLGGALGPWLGGFLFDIYGNYIGAFVFALVCIASACLCLWFAAPRKATHSRNR
ncbi:MAG: MFS transporter, partial [Candidatus Micrarchaeota archaeon]